jgi:hypothetical protein
MSDAEVARRMEADLEADLAVVEARPDIRAVVVATHHLAFEEAVLRSETLPWEFFNAFMGSVRLGEVIRGGRRVTHAVYGHTHRGRAFSFPGLSVHGTPLGYPRERAGVDDRQLLETRIGWIEA